MDDITGKKRMTLKKGHIIEADISDVAFGGRGIAKLEGMVVFVDQTIPGDRVTARVIRKKKSYAEARLVEMIHPSPFRIDPPCAYSGICGGCKWQFLDYEKQIQYKRRHVIDSLEHIALLEDVPVHETISSDRVFGYRNKMEFSCADRRWLTREELGRTDIDNGFAVGLHVPGTFHKVLDIERCLLQPEQGNAILDDIRRFIRKSGLPVYGLKSHIGFWRFVMLRHSVAGNQWLVNIITASEQRAAVMPLAEMLMEVHPEIRSVVNNINTRKAGIAIGEYEIPLAGEGALMDRIGRFEFEISANSFFQTNTRGAERLYDTVLRYAELTGSEKVLDLYSGTGTIAIYLSDNAGEVTGMEIVESAVADALKNCRENGVTNCRFIAGDIRENLSHLDSRPDVMIIDPPRAGMHKDVVKKIVETAPPRIVYVSCNPTTMARDLCLMKDVYRVKEVQPVDMFPHTFHIEAVARLDRI